ncbi:hypothetical protein Plhal304r1_c016g0058411 [Plasmopara halstedii]
MKSIIERKKASAVPKYDYQSIISSPSKQRDGSAKRHSSATAACQIECVITAKFLEAPNWDESWISYRYHKAIFGI